MTDKSGPLTREMVEQIINEIDTPEKARQFLQDAGLLDENGDLAPPYRPES